MAHAASITAAIIATVCIGGCVPHIIWAFQAALNDAVNVFCKKHLTVIPEEK